MTKQPFLLSVTADERRGDIIPITAALRRLFRIPEPWPAVHTSAVDVTAIITRRRLRIWLKYRLPYWGCDARPRPGESVADIFVRLELIEARRLRPQFESSSARVEPND